MKKRRVQAAKPLPSRQAAPVRPPAGDRWVAYGTLPLRLFLGATFVYAGIQKISDPGFLQPGSTTYIGSQLQAFAAQSPIGFLIEIFALPTPQLTGVGVIAAELAIGTLVLAGVATRWAAAGGAVINLVFFLTASWMVQPYFLGQDIIYTVAWITIVIVGDLGVFTVRPLLFGDAASRRPLDPERRKLLVQLGGAAVAGIWVLALLPRVRHTGGGGGQAGSSPTAEASPTAVASPTGTKVGSVGDLQSQGFLNFQDPKTGDPAVAVSLSGGSIVAFDAVCTHAGCQVSYDTGQKLLACPCHGALFDPAHGAAVVAGPAPTPLASIRVQVGSDGGVYAD